MDHVALYLDDCMPCRNGICVETVGCCWARRPSICLRALQYLGQRVNFLHRRNVMSPGLDHTVRFWMCACICHRLPEG